MEHFLLGIRYFDVTFTVRYNVFGGTFTFRCKELGWNIYCLVEGDGMLHLLLGIRKCGVTITGSYKEL